MANLTLIQAMTKTAELVYQKVKTLLGGKVDKIEGKGLSTNDYTAADKQKLEKIASGAEVNQNAFSNIKVGNTTIAADNKTDMLTFFAGNNMIIEADESSDVVTFKSQAGPDRVPFAVTEGTSSAYTITLPSDVNCVAVKFHVANAANATLKISNLPMSTALPIYYKGSKITANQIPANATVFLAKNNDAECWEMGYSVDTNTTYNVASSSANGLMSKTDKAKLDKIEDGANKTIVDSEGSYSSENPLQNKVIWSAITTIGTNITNIEQSYLQKNLKGQANGVAELDSSGKVPSTQLPGFVDDVVDSYIVSGSTALTAGWLSTTSSGKAFTPETGKIYNVVSSGEYQNQSYRWSGTAYVRLNEGVVLGETQYTAYRGDRGKTAYERSETFDKVYKGSDTTHMLVTQEEKTKWNGKQDKITIDESLSGSSSNPVQNKAVYNALQIDETTLTSAINTVLAN